LTTHLDQQMIFYEPYQCNHIVTKFKVILSNNLKKYGSKMSEFKSWLYENDIVCFVFKRAENLPTRRRKTEKHYIGLIYKINTFTYLWCVYLPADSICKNISSISPLDRRLAVIAGLRLDSGFVLDRGFAPR
jgi:hypothetical protein